MISLRQFDSSIAPVPTFSMAASRVREYTASTVLQFAAQPSDTLPSFIASFAHPIHVDSILSDADSDATFASESDGSEWREMDGIAPNRGLETPCGHIPTPGPSQTDPPAILEPSA
ncbi:hypothetical protein GSI_04936 [Ganoderma sinense ZZ0214-1]|uniref:Uncharacterized protein n=1 Tax=Ganoderma sinense ZZ0214-1 TaxID=1077348 RepID=A0A2G8SGC5_9APHY|nr:hypothetical protein GSI_04936 [Ganoderma sinense ZZ0214-1]